MKQLLKVLVMGILILPQVAVPMVPKARPHRPAKIVIPKANQKLMKQIKKNHPKLLDRTVQAVATAIDLASKKHNLRPERLAAIAMQESTYRLSEVSCFMVKGVKRCDYCMMQINDRTAKNFGFDKTKLLTDINYCIDAGAVVLKDFKRMYGKREANYWTRYNSNKDHKRVEYQSKVERWL